MKAIFILFALLASLYQAKAQKIKAKQVPEKVRAAFLKDHAHIKKALWEKELDNYEVEFKDKQVETSLCFNSDGELLETEVEIKTQDLPPTLIAYLKNNLAELRIKEVTKITNSEGISIYEIESAKQEYLFNENGSLISKKPIRD